MVTTNQQRKAKYNKSEKGIKNQREWFANNKEWVKNYTLKRKFGITLEQYKVLKEVQGGKCAICERVETFGCGIKNTLKDLSVDHNHETGKVRGLLCHKCNVVIGLVEENINILNKIINYIQKHNGS